jgi:hypothetical protein
MSVGLPNKVMKDLVEVVQKVNSHARELISEEPFHLLSLFIYILNSHPSRRVVTSINTPSVLRKTKFW